MTARRRRYARRFPAAGFRGSSLRSTRRGLASASGPPALETGQLLKGGTVEGAGVAVLARMFVAEPASVETLDVCVDGSGGQDIPAGRAVILTSDRSAYVGKSELTPVTARAFGAGVWVQGVFSSPPELEAGVAYWFGFESADSVQFAALQIASSPNGSYANAAYPTSGQGSDYLRVGTGPGPDNAQGTASVEYTDGTIGVVANRAA